MNQRLPKSSRIRQSTEIRQILTQGKKYIGNHLILYSLPSPNHEQRTRAGFLSPKKIGKAVMRNKVRRWMREIFRKEFQSLKSSQQLLMMGRTSATTASYQALYTDFCDLCRKARLIAERDS
jgi:ribonuclease P protein component